MKSIAFVFTHGPHGVSAGREGLDAILATSSLANNIGIFFIADGVLILLPHQQSAQILSRNFVAAFGILSLYNIDRFYLCAESALERGLDASSSDLLHVQWLSAADWRQQLAVYNTILTF